VPTWGRIVEDVEEKRFLKRGRITMLNASFGRELVEAHLRDALQQAEHRRLVGCLKRDRRAASARRKAAATPCPQDLG
jgi:hypothetical protein